MRTRKIKIIEGRKYHHKTEDYIVEVTHITLGASGKPMLVHIFFDHETLTHPAYFVINAEDFLEHFALLPVLKEKLLDLIKAFFCTLLLLFSCLPSYAYNSKTEEICDWMSSHIKYVPDETSTDEWKLPNHTLKDKEGDCEDAAVLVVDLLSKKRIEGKIVGIITSSHPKGQGHAIAAWQDPGTKTWSFYDHNATYQQRLNSTQTDRVVS